MNYCILLQYIPFLLHKTGPHIDPELQLQALFSSNYPSKSNVHIMSESWSFYAVLRSKHCMLRHLEWNIHLSPVHRAVFNIKTSPVGCRVFNNVVGGFITRFRLPF